MASGTVRIPDRSFPWRGKMAISIRTGPAQLSGAGVERDLDPFSWPIEVNLSDSLKLEPLAEFAEIARSDR